MCKCNCKAAIAIENSANAKLGAMSTTYAAPQSCPKTCPFLKGGCYTMSGRVAIIRKRLHGKNPLEIARKEAAAIDGLTGDRHLRIHTAGDCRTPVAARTVASAAERYMRRGGRKAFTYTHAWRDVPRKSWGKVSVLASCETADAVRRAMGRGYGAAIVLGEEEKPAAKRAACRPESCLKCRACIEVRDGVKVLPCPKQTGRMKNCAACRMCMLDKELKKARTAVGFFVHGPTRKARAALGAAPR